MGKLVSAIPPAITVQIARQTLETISADILTWNDGGDKQAVGRLNAVVKQIKSVFRLKSGGVDAYTDRQDIQTGLLAVIDLSKQIGLFIAPVGELEAWIQTNEVSKDRKAEWEARAVVILRDSVDNTSRLHNFLREIQTYLGGAGLLVGE